MLDLMLDIFRPPYDVINHIEEFYVYNIKLNTITSLFLIHPVA